MMALQPEQLARQKIDALLVAAGWVLQDKDEFDRTAALGVAVREFQLPSGPCDYLLFVDGKAAGVVEAKPAGVTLSGVAEQSEKYMAQLPSHLKSWGSTLLVDYESTGEETFFRFMRDPVPRSRRVFAFHKPETLKEWLEDSDTLRGRLAKMPPLVKAGLRDCQIEAIEGLETSLAQDKPRSLIQMATGAGKTFTACTFSYRLIKHAKAKRILFLVDRNNLGNQTLREFQNFDPPGEGHKFPNVYNVQHLHANRIDKDAKVVITTIQRLFAMLKGQELDPEAEEFSAFETSRADGPTQEVAYNPAIPIEMFDMIVTDECHRSIYGVWRQVLEYFDAHIIGLTATPSSHTLGYFGQNLVAEYPYERSVADGVNVGYEIFRIRTQVTEQGGKVDAKFAVGVRDRRTRKLRYEQLDEDLDYIAKDVDRAVTVPNQIRLILQTYKQVLSTELFPGRDWVPKTLIFAKDDNHAEEIVHIAREVFNGGNDFAKKITYRTTGESPQELLKSFRVDPNPRIAVTVDMIATGTDVRPIEVLIFMRDVKSGQYFEQMKGRGARIVADSDLRQVTPDAVAKTKFILIDAVGVTESLKSVSRPLERKRGVTFDRLLDQVAQGDRDEDNISSLAARLAALAHDIEDEDRASILKATGGLSLKDLANRLLDAIDPDKITEAAEKLHGQPVTDEQFDKVEEKLQDAACAPFNSPTVRQLLKDIRHRSQVVIDDKTQDALIPGAGFSSKQAEQTVAKFKDFIENNKDELLALQILYSQPYKSRHLTYAAIKELSDAMTRSPWYLDTATVWQAYKRLDNDNVKGAPTEKLLTNIISLVRFAVGQEKTLEPFSVQVVQRFNLWMGRQKKAGNDFTGEQIQWLEMIRDHIAANAAIEPSDLQEIPNFSSQGGLIRARVVFGTELGPLLDDMNKALVA